MLEGHHPGHNLDGYCLGWGGRNHVVWGATHLGSQVVLFVGVGSQFEDAGQPTNIVKFFYQIRNMCFEGGPHPPGSWLGNLPNRKTPRGGGGVSCDDQIRVKSSVDLLPAAATETVS